MNLRNNDAFSTIDDKCAAVGHERNIAHVDIFLQNGSGFLKGQVDSCLKRNRIGQALLLTFQF